MSTAIDVASSALPTALDPCARVRETTLRVVSAARSVSIQEEALQRLAAQIIEDVQSSGGQGGANGEWDADGWHFSEDCDGSKENGWSADGRYTTQYIFVVDALNWCFWPCEGFSYVQLATRLRDVLLKDREAFDAERLQQVTPEVVHGWFQPFEISQASERAEKVRELGAVLSYSYGGWALNMVRAADCSAVRLVKAVADALPGFRDHCIYRGEQVFFYKRAQILVADLWAAFGQRTDRKHPCAFDDMKALTMFADYRVPQILREEGVLAYAEELAAAVDAEEPLTPGSEAEVEIRAATIQVVERIQAFARGRGVSGILSVHIDWLLWWRATQCPRDNMRPLHRTLTSYY